MLVFLPAVFGALIIIEISNINTETSLLKIFLLIVLGTLSIFVAFKYRPLALLSNYLQKIADKMEKK
jgi:hypothetical protein